MGRPFKKFYCDRKELFQLSGNALKVWLYHYSRENSERESWPSIETITKECDLSEKTVKQCHKWLLDHKWVKKVNKRQPHASNGQFEVTTYTVMRGDIPWLQNTVGQKSTNGDTGRGVDSSVTVGQKLLATVGQKLLATVGQKLPLEEESLRSRFKEEDSKGSRGAASGPNRETPDEKQKAKTQAETTDSTPEPEGKNHPTVKLQEPWEGDDWYQRTVDILPEDRERLRQQYKTWWPLHTPTEERKAALQRATTQERNS